MVIGRGRKMCCSRGCMVVFCVQLPKLTRRLRGWRGCSRVRTRQEPQYHRSAEEEERPFQIGTIGDHGIVCDPKRRPLGALLEDPGLHQGRSLSIQTLTSFEIHHRHPNVLSVHSSEPVETKAPMAIAASRHQKT